MILLCAIITSVFLANLWIILLIIFYTAMYRVKILKFCIFLIKYGSFLLFAINTLFTTVNTFSGSGNLFLYVEEVDGPFLGSEANKSVNLYSTRDDTQSTESRQNGSSDLPNNEKILGLSKKAKILSK